MKASFDMKKKKGKGYKRVKGDVVKNNNKTIWVKIVKKADGIEKPFTIKRHKTKHNVETKERKKGDRK